MGNGTTGIAVLALGALVGCASNTIDSGTKTNGDGSLEVVGTTSRNLEPFENHQLEFRYLDADGNRVEDIVVDFGFEGRTNGADMSRRSSRTNHLGIASVGLTAGEAANFRVVAFARNVEAAIGIDVRELQQGDLDYVVTYGGDRFLDTVEVGLFSNTTCAHIDRRVPAPRDAQPARLDRRETFRDVDLGVNTAVYAVGITSDDRVLAEGCNDIRPEEDGEQITVRLEDREISGGAFETEEVYDIRGGSFITRVIDLFLGLAANPAEYLIDFAAEEGLLGGVASWGIAKSVAVSILNDFVDDWLAPDYRFALEEVHDDFRAALTEMTFHGEMGWSSDREEDEVEQEGYHRVNEVVFPLESGRALTYRVNEESEMWVSVLEQDLTIYDHELDIPVGMYVADLLEERLIPRLPGSPTSAVDIVDEVIDCRAFARWIGFDSSTAEDITIDICEIGVEALGRTVDRWIDDLRENGMLHVEGIAYLEEPTRDYLADEIEDGDLDAWYETRDAGELLSFPGRVTGRRIEDGAKGHPVLDRIRESFR
jgi:hypothetical protein